MHKNVNYVKRTIWHNQIMIHPNSNFDNITDANITAINEENELIALAKLPFSATLYKNRYFLLSGKSAKI